MFRTRTAMLTWVGGCFALAAFAVDGLVAADGPDAADRPGSLASDKKALAVVQAFVGEWKGVGQPKRGSNQGAWTEESQWAWRFKDDRAQLEAQLSHDKYFSHLRLQAGDQPGQFLLLATRADDAGGATKEPPRRFVGALRDGALVLVDETAPADQPARITLRLVAGGDRLLVLHEKRSGNDYLRLAEVGSTRKGSSFAKATLGGPECIVTGGLGTIAVKHDGKTYYVCCTGCRDAFLEDPEAILAEYHQRKAAESK